MSAQASAPGKLMLAGEYAVARAGAPAVACAVTARLHVAFETGGAEAVVSSARAELEGAPLAAVPVLEALVDRLAPQGLGGQFTITSELGFGSAKPGLGSSAALVVAAAGALCASEGWTPLSLTELIDVHRAGQGGGSGYDVATALYGGVCRFQHRSDGHDVRTLAWPDGLHYRVVHLGSGVSTGAQLAKLDAGLEGSGAAVGAALDAQCAASVAVADALDQGTSGLSELAHHETTLRALDRAAGLGVATPAYLALASIVGDAGAILRTAGAGAGDSAWIFAADSLSVERAAAAARGAGFLVLPLSVDAQGLEIRGASNDG